MNLKEDLFFGFQGACRKTGFKTGIMSSVTSIKNLSFQEGEEKHIFKEQKKHKNYGRRFNDFLMNLNDEKRELTISS